MYWRVWRESLYQLSSSAKRLILSNKLASVRTGSGLQNPVPSAACNLATQPRQHQAGVGLGEGAGSDGEPLGRGSMESKARADLWGQDSE